MHLLSPLWLFALAPWSAVVLWLLWGRRRKTPVAFLDLWRGPALQKPTKRALQPPPVFLGLALLATLMAILSAARPRAFPQYGPAAKPNFVIVDRGLSMSSLSSGKFRFQLLAEQAGQQLAEILPGETPIELLAIPGKGSRSTSLSAMAGQIAEMPPSAIASRALVEQAVRNQLATGDGPVVVIRDQALPFDDARVIQFASQGSVENIGIVRLAARETPHPQIMVRLRNDSSRKTVGIKVISGSHSAERSVELPPRETERDYFFDLPKLDTVIEATLETTDDQPADDRAFLVREGSYPKLEIRASVSAELRRMVEVYAKSRPPADGSSTLAVASDETDLPTDTAAVWIAPISGPHARGSASVASLPGGPDFSGLKFPADVETAGKPPLGCTPIVRVDSQVIVAALPGQKRKIWVGFDAAGWSATPDFVIFWASVFNWTGAGEERFAAYPLARFEPGWTPMDMAPSRGKPSGGQWPGLYRSEEGLLRAYQVPTEVASGRAQTTKGWREKLGGRAGTDRLGYDLGPPLLILALAAMVASAMTWKRRILTPVSPDRTFSH